MNGDSDIEFDSDDPISNSSNDLSPLNSQSGTTGSSTTYSYNGILKGC